MNEDISTLKNKAEDARILYNLNRISRDEAKEIIIPYLDEVNKLSVIIAKKYNQKPTNIDFISFCR